MVRSFSEYSAGTRWVGKHFTQTCALGLAIYAGAFSQANADQESQALVQSHEQELSENRSAAQNALVEGDTFYNSADYAQATAAYRKACSLLGNAPATAALRASAVERFAQSAVEQSTQLVRLGMYDGARTVLNEALAADMAPHHVGVQTALAKLDDPTHTNPALTPEITRDAEAAGKWLMKAEGFLNLGKYDEAVVAYEEVLLLDPYNKAARRGMERVNAATSSYADAARDHARSQALGDVDAAWETFVKPQNLDQFDTDAVNQGLDRVQEVRGNQLRQTVIPVVDFQDVNLSEAYETVRVWSQKYASPAEGDSGLNFVVNLGSADAEAAEEIQNKRFNLSLKNVPLSQVLDYISEATGTQWRVGDHAVLVTPYGAADTTIRRRTFNVPPTFMQDAKANAAGNDDPFGGGSQDSALQGRVSAKQFLTSLGVTFPEGTSAKYIASTSSLIVTNTATNLDIIETYVDSYKRGDNVQVVLKVTIIETKQKNLEDLGFDWLVSGRQQGSSVTIGGGNQGNGFAVPTVSLPHNGNPISSGLRSGDTLFTTDTLDSAINGTLGGSSRSPGILTLTAQDFQVVMRGLSQKGDTSRLDTATMIARSGEKTTLFSGREFIYPTEYEPPELPTTSGSSNGGAFPVTPATPTAFETRRVGMSLEAEAVVSEDRHYIDLQITPNRVDFEGFVNYGSPISTSVSDPITGLPVDIEITKNSILQPVFKTINLKGGHVTVQDGATFAIAGLTQSTIETIEDKIPIVGDAPLIGRLFRSEGKSKVDSVLLIMVNVELQDPTGRPLRDQ